MRLYQLLEGISKLSDELMQKYDLASLFLYEKDGVLSLDMIEVPKKSRKQGIGTAVMNEIIQYADQNKLRVFLTPDSQNPDSGTSSRARLVKFYKRFGFVENKGRNKDFSISIGMFRNPK